MPVTRRTALTILGGIALGYGTAGATGAFDRVVLERDLEIEVGGDDGGFLTIVPHPDREDTTYGPDVDFDEDGLVYVDFSTWHINDDSVYDFHDLLQVTNNGSKVVNLEVDAEKSDGLYSTDPVTVYRDEAVGDPIGTISPGETINLGMQIDARGDSDLETLTILRFKATSVTT